MCAQVTPAPFVSCAHWLELASLCTLLTPAPCFPLQDAAAQYNQGALPELRAAWEEAHPGGLDAEHEAEEGEVLSVQVCSPFTALSL